MMKAPTSMRAIAALRIWHQRLLERRLFLGKFSTTGLRRDTSGIAAIEFALIVPLMLMMFFGMLDVSNGFAIDRKVSLIAQTVSDLASRNTALSTVDTANFATIADAIVTPYSTAPLNVTVSQLYINPSTNAATVVWSRGDAALAKGTVVPIPSALVGKDASGNTVANQYLLFAQATYLYTPTIGWVVAKTGITISETSFTKPRQSTCVQLPTSCTPSSG